MKARKNKSSSRISHAKPANVAKTNKEPAFLGSATGEKKF